MGFRKSILFDSVEKLKKERLNFINVNALQHGLARVGYAVGWCCSGCHDGDVLRSSYARGAWIPLLCVPRVFTLVYAHILRIDNTQWPNK